jgi:RNA polymerase sigma factor (sigma-70 family)
MNDWDLLQDYFQHGSEEAFAAVVQRHLDLVYSAALRQVRSPELAQDVTQSVFTDLARGVRRLKPDSVLASWLYEVTRRTAIDLIRKESRRQARERVASEIIDMNPDASSWTFIEPLLDEAMETLEQSDRTAVILRYFENKTLREVGASLGTSEDAAQKRVSRATERLREFLVKRGVAIGTGGLALLISANAVQSAPAGLGSIVCSASVLSAAAIHQTATIGLTKAIAMTTIQKTLFTAVFAAALGTAIYEMQRSSRLQAQNLALENQQGPLSDEVQQLRKAQKELTGKWQQAQDEADRLRQAAAELPKLRGELARLKNDSRESAKLKRNGNQTEGGDTESTAKSWLARASELKQMFQQKPDKSVPEFQLLTEQDWLDASRDKLETEEDYRHAMSRIRTIAAEKFANLIQPALGQYAKANDGKFPTDLSQLQPFLKSPVDPSILQRYGIFPSAAVPNVGMGGDWMITQRAFVDEEYDTRFVIGPNGHGSTSYKQTPLDNLAPALKAFSAANNGQQPTDPSELLPYATTADQQAALQTWIQRSGTNNSR